MSLNLEEVNVLIAALGITVPEEVLRQKAQAAEFKQRQEKILAAAATKPPDWQLKEDFAEVQKRSQEAAGKKEFDPALKLLDEMEKILKQPDLAPEVLAALKSMAGRQAALEVEIGRLQAYESPIGAELKSGMEVVAKALKERNAETAGKRLGELEQMTKAFEQKKLAAEAAAREAQAAEQARIKARLDELKKQIETGLAETKLVVESIQEPALAKPSADGLVKLKTSLEAALKLAQPTEQETTLVALSKEVAPLKAGADKAAVEATALVAARARVTALKVQAAKELAEADVAVKAILDPSLTAPEAPKLEALSKRHAASLGVTDLAAQESEFSALLVDIAKLKQDAAAAKVKADEIKATQVRVTQKIAAIDLALTELKKVIDGIQEKTIKDDLVAGQTPLTQERARISTLTTPEAQELALTQLETDTKALKDEADNLVLWDAWFKDTWNKDSKNTKDWIGDVKEVAAKTVLQAEWDALQQEKTNFLTALDYSSAQSVTHPKLIEVYKAANRICKHGPEVDVEIHNLFNLVVAVKGEVTESTVINPITAGFKALEAEKKSSWPTGGSAAAILTAMDTFDAKVADLRAKAESARGKVLGKDPARRDAKIKQIEQALETIDDALTNVEKEDWAKIAKLPAPQKDPLLKMKAEFETVRTEYKKLEKRLKAAPKISNYEARGKELVALGKESSIMMGTVLRRGMKLMVQMKGAKEADEMIQQMPNTANKPEEIEMCKALIEARFGIKIEIGEEFKAKSLPRIGKMLARVPEWQTRQSKTGPDGTAKEKTLKTLTYSTEPKAKGNYFSSSRKTIGLQGMTEKGGDNDEHTLVSDSGKAVKTSYFDFTTLHEIGHAVDDRIKFMSSRMEKDGFGKWKKESFKSVLDAFLPGLVADCTGGTKKAQAADLEAMLTDLLKTGTCAKPANATAKLGSLFTEWDQIEAHAVVVKCKKGLFTNADPWDKGKALAQAVELGGRVYHEAYDNDWYSYALADRATTGVTTYQWRAPGEWFAEIYALYYLNKLSRSHPMSSWFRNAAKSEAKASKV